MRHDDRVFDEGAGGAPELEQVLERWLRPFCAAAFEPARRASPEALPMLDLEREWWYVCPASLARAALAHGRGLARAMLPEDWLARFLPRRARVWARLAAEGAPPMRYAQFHKLLFLLTSGRGLVWMQTNVRARGARVPVYYVGWPSRAAPEYLERAGRDEVGASASSTHGFCLRTRGRGMRVGSEETCARALRELLQGEVRGLSRGRMDTLERRYARGGDRCSPGAPPPRAYRVGAPAAATESDEA